MLPFSSKTITIVMIKVPSEFTPKEKEPSALTILGSNAGS